MKTILEIVEEHIAKQAAAGSNPATLKINAHEALMRMQKRFEQDPALVLLTTHYAKAVMTILLMLPPQAHTSAIQSVMVQVIQAWEDVHRTFENQLAPPSGYAQDGR